MSLWVESEPCKAQAAVMRKLGFASRETDDTGVAVWARGFMELRIPARDELTFDRAAGLIMDAAHRAGVMETQAAMRRALGLR